MILAIDAGNTRIKWGVHDGYEWHAQGVLELGTAVELANVIAAAPAVQLVVAANVAGASAAAYIEQAAERCAVPLRRVVACSQQCGVVNSYDEPAQLGADRWAALIGARAQHAGACLVVGAGTATTIDVLDANGVFLGGMILPGYDLMRAALARNTAQLELADGRNVALPRNTADAIASGCLSAQAGAIERMFAVLPAHADSLCLLSGGNAAALAEVLKAPWRQADNLVLEGLARIGRDAT